MRTSRSFFMFTAALLVACPLSAQESSSAAIAATPAVAASASATTPTPAVTPGATATEARFAPIAATKDGTVRRLNGTETVTAPAAPMSAMRSPNRHNEALMIVGAAGILLGAVVGGQAGTIIMIGSGVIGLYGLYQYVQ